MAVAYTAGVLKPYFAYRCETGDPVIKHMPVAASMTDILYGHVLEIATASELEYVTEAVAVPSAGNHTTGGATDNYFGVALNTKAISTTAAGDETIPVLVFQPGLWIALRLFHDTPADSAWNDASAGVAVGTILNIARYKEETADGTGDFYVFDNEQQGSGSNDLQFQVMALDEDSAVDDLYPVIWCECTSDGRVLGV